MRFLSLPPSLSALALLLLNYTAPTYAKPYPRDYLDERDATSLQNSTELVKRCDGTPCGWSGQLCCTGGQTCYTDSNNQAQCGDGSAATVTGAAAASGSGDSGSWVLSTTTWTETDAVTHTATFSSFLGGAAPTAQATGTGGGAPTCDYAANESPCGDICCASGQYCYTSGQCKDAGNGGYTTLAGGGTTAAGPASPPTRPTTISNSLTTQTISPTVTTGFQTPVPTGANVTVTGSQSSGGGLSGGAIAGIVIGVLLGLALLALLCFCCIVRGLWGLFLGLFGGRRRDKRRRVEETYVEEIHRHGSQSGGRVWYGDRPARPSRAGSEKKSGWRSWAPVAGVVGALGLGLAGKRQFDKRKRREEKSDISSSYYSYDYTTETSKSIPTLRGGRERKLTR